MNIEFLSQQEIYGYKDATSHVDWLNVPLKMIRSMEIKRLTWLTFSGHWINLSWGMFPYRYHCIRRNQR